MKSLLPRKSFFFIAFIFLTSAQITNAANITSSATGNWSATAWPNTGRTGTITSSTGSATLTGSGTSFTTELSVGNIIKTTGNVVIGTIASIQSNTSLTFTGNAASTNAGIAFRSQGVGPVDAITIAAGHTVTVNGSFTCASLTYATGSNLNTIVQVSGSNSLIITGLVTLVRPSTSGFACRLSVNAGTVTMGSLTMTATTGTRNDSVSVSTGTITITGTITCSGIASILRTLGSGRVNINSTTISSNLTLTIDAASTINYGGTAQTLKLLTYGNLTISGSGAKTFPTGTTTVNGIFSMEGTATATYTGTLALGANATLNYNRTASLTAGAEWVTPFVATGGVIIESNTVTLNAAKVFNADIPLNINLGAELNTSGSNFALTFNGDFINDGTLTAGSSAITITGSSTQDIDGFTTTGTVSMTKASGTATLTGNVNGGALTINGTAGILNMGASLTHQFTGTFTRTAGSIDGGSSLTRFSGSGSGVGATFTASSSTIEWNNAGNQNVSGMTYHHIVFSGSGTKTLSTGLTTVNGDFTISGSAIVVPQIAASIAGDLTIGSGTTFTGGAFTHNVAGDWINNGGTFTNTGTTINLNGVAQNIGGSSANSFLNLTVAGTAKKTMTSNCTVTGALVLTGQDLAINGHTLTIDGTESGTGFLEGSATSNLVVSSASAAQATLAISQTSNTTRSFNNLTFSRTNGTSLNDTINLIGTLTISNGTFTTSNKLYLNSDANATASIAAINSGAISGNVIAERFIPGGTVSKRKWRLLSSPVNNSGSIAITELIDDIIITGSGTGFDACAGCLPSLRTYTESTAGLSSVGWTNPPSTSTTIATGIGFEVFVRGSRGLANPFINWTVPDNVTIDYVGAVNTGTINKSLSFTNTGNTTADGFNLVGNPYPSTIDWMSASGWTRTNMQNFMWAYDANLGTYGVIDFSNGTTSGNVGISRYIPSGQAFFVRATTSGASIQFTEAVKASNTAFNFFRSLPVSLLKIRLSIDSIKTDATVIVFTPNSTKQGNDNNDAVKFYNDKLNLFTVSRDTVSLAINSRPLPETIDTVKLSVFSYDSSNVFTTTHTLNFDSLNTIDVMYDMFLVDQFTNQKINIRNTSSYSFDITTDPNSWGNNRFILIFKNTSIGINNNEDNFELNIFPNPGTNIVNVQVGSNYQSSSFKYEIIDQLGRTILNGNLSNPQINIHQLNAGVYFIKVYNGQINSIRKFIKKG